MAAAPLPRLVSLDEYLHADYVPLAEVFAVLDEE